MYPFPEAIFPAFRINLFLSTVLMKMHLLPAEHSPMIRITALIKLSDKQKDEILLPKATKQFRSAKSGLSKHPELPN